jgi:hypothetical protein
MGGNVPTVGGERSSSGSFAALRMTAGTCNHNDHGNDKDNGNGKDKADSSAALRNDNKDSNSNDRLVE